MFKYFNPLWLIQNFLQTSLNPITIGAGVGALGSAVTGKNPIKGALLGGALGGLGNAAGLFSATGAATEAAKQATGSSLFSGVDPLTGGGVGNLGMFTNPQATSVMGGIGDVSGLGVSGTYAQNAPIYAGQGGMFDVAGTQNQILGGIGQQTAMGGGGYDPSMLGSIQRGAESGYNGLEGWLKNNPGPVLNTTGQLAISAMTPQPMPQPQMPAPAQIRPGSYNTAPTLGQGPNEKVASRIQLTPQQLQLYPSYFRGGY